MLKRTTILALGMLLLACGASEEAPAEPALDERAMCEMRERALPIPFDHTLTEEALTLHGAAEDVRVYIGPWGAHAQPHTGHPEGNWKADWAAPTAYGFSDQALARLPYNGPVDGAPEPGACVPGAVCGVHVDDMVARIPPYAMPDDVTVVRVALIGVVGDGSDPLQDYNWEVEVEYCPYRVTFGHVGRISDALADALVAAGHGDPRDRTEPGAVLEPDQAPVTLAAGTPIGFPQTLAQPVLNWPEYRQGRGTLRAVPWAEIEWTGVRMQDSAGGVSRPEYAMMGTDVQQDLAALLLSQRGDEDLLRYAEWRPWLWLADTEMVLATAWELSRTSTDTIFDRLGGWYEQNPDGACAPYQDTMCDETFSIWPAMEDSPFFDPSRYFHEDVRYFVMRGPNHQYDFGEVLAPESPDPIVGSLIIGWRGPDSTGGEAEYTGYQSVGYRLQGGELRLHYGPTLDPETVVDPMSIATQAPPPADGGCDGGSRVCMSSEAYGRL